MLSMTDEIDNQLSLFADGDLDRERASFLVHRLSQDPRLKAKWSRLHLAGGILRKQAEPSVRADFSERVMARLDEPEAALPSLESKQSPQRWRRPLAGMALAASISAAMVGGAVFGNRDSEPQTLASNPVAPATVVQSDQRRTLEAQLAQPIAVQSAMAGDGNSAQLAPVAFGSELSAYLVQRRVGTVYLNGQPTPIVVVKRTPESAAAGSDNSAGQLVNDRR